MAKNNVDKFFISIGLNADKAAFSSFFKSVLGGILAVTATITALTIKTKNELVSLKDLAGLSGTDTSTYQKVINGLKELGLSSSAAEKSVMGIRSALQAEAVGGANIFAAIGVDSKRAEDDFSGFTQSVYKNISKLPPVRQRFFIEALGLDPTSIAHIKKTQSQISKAFSIGASGQIVSESSIESAKRLDIIIGRLGQSFTKLFADILEKYEPELTSVLDSVNKFLVSNSKTISSEVGGAIKFILTGYKKLSEFNWSGLATGLKYAFEVFVSYKILQGIAGLIGAFKELYSILKLVRNASVVIASIATAGVALATFLAVDYALSDDGESVVGKAGNFLKPYLPADLVDNKIFGGTGSLSKFGGSNNLSYPPKELYEIPKSSIPNNTFGSTQSSVVNNVKIDVNGTEPQETADAIVEKLRQNGVIDNNGWTRDVMRHTNTGIVQ